MARDQARQELRQALSPAMDETSRWVEEGEGRLEAAEAVIQAKLVVIGGCRSEASCDHVPHRPAPRAPLLADATCPALQEDQRRLDSLQRLSKDLGLSGVVEFRPNESYQEMRGFLGG